MLLGSAASISFQIFNKRIDPLLQVNPFIFSVLTLTQGNWKEKMGKKYEVIT